MSGMATLGVPRIPLWRRCSHALVSPSGANNILAALPTCDRIRVLDNKKGLWDDTVLFFASDNGGPVFIAGDNGPFRGGKAEYYEGGLLAPAFVYFGPNTVDVSHPALRAASGTALGCRGFAREPPEGSEGWRGVTKGMGYVGPRSGPDASRVRHPREATRPCPRPPPVAVLSVPPPRKALTSTLHQRALAREWTREARRSRPEGEPTPAT